MGIAAVLGTLVVVTAARTTNVTVIEAQHSKAELFLKVIVDDAGCVRHELLQLFV